MKEQKQSKKLVKKNQKDSGFVISEVAQLIGGREFLTNYEIHLEKQGDVNPKAVVHALKTICNDWNKSLQSRRFIQHLIGAFLPLNPHLIVRKFDDEATFNPEMDMKELKIFVTNLENFTKSRCAITNYGLIGTSLMSKIQTKTALSIRLIESHIAVHGSSDKSKEDIAEIRDVVNSYPASVTNTTVALSSKDSNKFITTVAGDALLFFSQEMILRDDKDVIFTVKKSHMKTMGFDKSFNKKEQNQILRAATYNMSDAMDSNTFDKLKQFRDNLK